MAASLHKFKSLDTDYNLERWVNHCTLTSPKQSIVSLPEFIDHQDLSDMGFKKVTRDGFNNFQTGLESHQTDRPQAIARFLFKRGYTKVLFKIEFTSRSVIEFTAYTK